MGTMVSQITSLTIVWLNRLFMRRSKKTSKLHITGLCAGNSPVTGEFPAQMASKAENVSIWWRHHDGICLGHYCLSTRKVNSLSPGRCGYDLKYKLSIIFSEWYLQYFQWILQQDQIDYKSALVQVMAGTAWQQAIIWTIVDPHLCYHVALLGHNELMGFIGEQFNSLAPWRFDCNRNFVIL